MRRLAMVLFLMFAVAFVFTACGGGDDDDGGEKSGLGESCAKTDDCESGLKCIDQECVQDENSSDDGDSGSDDNNNETNGDSTDYDNLVWTDYTTGLMWQSEPTGGAMDWESAVSHCEDLLLDGYSDWRLPNIEELGSLIRGCEEGYAASQVPEYFDGCFYDDGPADGCYWPDEMDGSCSMFWSSSPVEDYDSRAWYVDFDGGNVLNDNVGNSRYVRCVR